MQQIHFTTFTTLSSIKFDYYVSLVVQKASHFLILKIYQPESYSGEVRESQLALDPQVADPCYNWLSYC